MSKTYQYFMKNVLKTPNVFSNSFGSENRLNDLQPDDWYSALMCAFKNRVASLGRYYFAIADAFINCKALVDFCSEHQDAIRLLRENPRAVINGEQEIPITDEDHDLMLAGLVGALTSDGQSINGGNWITITDSDGVLYAIRVIDDSVYGKTLDGEYPIITYHDGSWYLSLVLLGFNFTSNEEMWDELLPDEASALMYVLNDLSMKEETSAEENTASSMLEALCVKNGIEFQNMAQAVRELGALHSISFVNLSESLTQISVAEGRLTSLVPEEESSEEEKPNATIKATGDKKNVMDVFVDLAASAQINDTLSVCADAVSAASPRDLLQSALNKVSTTTSYLGLLSKNMLQNAIDSVAGNGSSGLMSYLMSYMRSQSTIVQRDGTIKYTDNTALVPKQFIAGIVKTAIISATQVASAIVTMIKPAIGIIMSAVTTIVQAVTNSIGTAIDNEYVKIREAYTADRNVCLNAGPMSVFRGSIVKNGYYYQYLNDLFDISSAPKSFSVPGGYIVMGPGHVTSDGSISSLIWEFHPLAFYSADTVRPSEFSAASKEMFCFVFADHGSHGQSGADIISDRPVDNPWWNANKIANLWYEVRRRWDKRAPGYGLSNDKVDDQLLCGAMLSTFFFIMWTHALIRPGDYPPDTNTYAITPGFIDQDPQMAMENFYWMGSIMGIFTRDRLNQTITLVPGYTEVGEANKGPYRSHGWTSFLNWFAEVQNNPDVIPGLRDIVYNYSVYDGSESCIIDNYTTPYLDDRLGMFMRDEYLDRFHILSDYSDHPLRIDYEYKIPLYDATTLWKWTFASIAVVTVTVVATVVTTTIVKRAIQKRRTDLVLDNQKARDEYAAARNGVKTTVDAEGHIQETTFDPKSPEGKAFVSGKWTAYRKNARSANFQAMLIGGSKFDVTSFYGDKSEGDVDTSAAGRSWTSRIWDSMQAQSQLVYDNDLDTSALDASVDLSDVIKIITGH